MKCDCCGKHKCWLESYEDIIDGQKRLHICVKCSTLVYKIRDASKTGNEAKDVLIAELEKRMYKESKDFQDWFYKKFKT